MSCDDNKEARTKDRAKRRSLPIAGQSSTPTYWRSAAEKEQLGPTPGAANEFGPGTFDINNAEEGVSRRGFMQVLSVSTAIAAVGAACKKPHDKIVPFVRRPEEVVPGNPLHFATAYALDGYASGLLVDSNEGRPTKIEGNPAHPRRWARRRSRSRAWSSAFTTTTAPRRSATGTAPSRGGRSWRRPPSVRAASARTAAAPDCVSWSRRPRRRC